MKACRVEKEACRCEAPTSREISDNTAMLMQGKAADKTLDELKSLTMKYTV